MLCRSILIALLFVSCGEGIKVELGMPEIPEQFQCRKIKASFLFFQPQPNCGIYAQSVNQPIPAFFALCSQKKSYMIQDDSQKVQNCWPYKFYYQDNEYKTQICGSNDNSIDSIIKKLRYTEMCDFPENNS